MEARRVETRAAGLDSRQPDPAGGTPRIDYAGSSSSGLAFTQRITCTGLSPSPLRASSALSAPRAGAAGRLLAGGGDRRVRCGSGAAR